jgi:hypothetical protein
LSTQIRRNTFLGLVGCALSLGFASAAFAAPTTLTVVGTVSAVEGSYAGDFLVGQSFTGSFTYDTDENNAGPGSITSPSTVPGHEFSSFYDFLGAAYEVFLSFPAVPGTFDGETVSVVVNDDLPLSADDLNDALPDGTYDWIEILGSTAEGICLEPGGVCAPDEYSPADGEEWTLAIFSDTSWIDDGSLVPDDFPPTYSALIVGIEVDPLGVETGLVFADVVVTQQTAPVLPGIGGPGSVALMGLLMVVGVASQRVLANRLTPARTASQRLRLEAAG